jgi:hypothetical protein
MRRLLQGIAFSLIVLSLWGCAPGYTKYISLYREGPLPDEPDYSRLDCWAAHPRKADPSDSIPLPLRNSFRADTTVDVFFLHPTTLTGKKDERWNAAINDAAINAKTDYSTILYQASVFNEYRVFAPRYRQAHIRAYFTRDSAAAEKAFNLAYEDIKKAFKYYLDHDNNGRPIIIASHSQGSSHALHLLKEFFDSAGLKKRLVVAYVVGMYIPGNYFSTLKPCTDSLQTGCVCGWRSFKKGYEPAFVKKEGGSGLVTNPLSWTITGEPASYTLNRGSVLKKFNKMRYGVAGACIHDGVLWIDRLRFPGAFLLRMKNFHIGDINIFYENIREDTRRRVKYFRGENASIE